MELILLGHILGDFYIQTDMIAQNKVKKSRYMVIHCILYTLVIYVFLSLLTQSWGKTIVGSLVIGTMHLITDIIKVKIEGKTNKYECKLFLLDQLIHIIVLFFVIYLFSFEKNINGMTNLILFGKLPLNKIIGVVILALVCWKPAEIIVSLVLKKITEYAEKENAKIGRWIGVLEREIILLLGLLGQYAAIGFVIAAKSLARFSKLENQDFAEKYLVGTLLSSLISMCCIGICKILIL